MWSLLKAELAYSKYAWLFSYGICLTFFVAAAVKPDWSIFHYMMNTTITCLITIAVIGAEADGEKATRFSALLPIPPRALAVTDVLYVALFQLGMVVLWTFLLAFKPAAATASTGWGMISHNGLTLSVITALIVHGHLGFCGTGRYKRISYVLLLAIAATIAGIAYSGRIGALARFVWHHYASPSGALASTLLWLGLSHLSVILYARRNSYLK